MLWAIFGRRASGKTELAKQASYRLANSNGLVLVYDLMGQWPREYHVPIASLYDQEKLDSRLYCVSDCEPEDAAALAKKWAPATFVMDEVDLICGGPNSWKSPTARDIVRRGRHFGVSMIVNGQRFVNCHTDILSLADHISVFFMNHYRDLQVIRDWMGREYEKEVQSLGQYEFVTYPKATVSKLGIGGEPATERSFGESNVREQSGENNVGQTTAESGETEQQQSDSEID
jgi:hypothetical protein